MQHLRQQKLCLHCVAFIGREAFLCNPDYVEALWRSALNARQHVPAVRSVVWQMLLLVAAADSANCPVPPHSILWWLPHLHLDSCLGGLYHRFEQLQYEEPGDQGLTWEGRGGRDCCGEDMLNPMLAGFSSAAGPLACWDTSGRRTGSASLCPAPRGSR